MEQIEVLDSLAHAGLRVDPRADARLGDARHFVPIVIGEFADVAASYPILLAKNQDTGVFFAGAVLGLRQDENLFLGPRGQSSYRPLGMRREPFFIAGEQLAIDIAHPRVGRERGEPLFVEDGDPSPYLKNIQSIVTQLKYGMDATDRFIRRMLELKLVEPIDIALSFDDGERLQLDGLYSIGSDLLHELDDADALRLFRDGDLQAAFLIVQSLRQLPVLARLRNERLLDPA